VDESPPVCRSSASLLVGPAGADNDRCAAPREAESGAGRIPARILRALPVASAAPTVRLNLVPSRSQILRLIHLIYQRVHLPLPVRIEPVGQSPRRLTEGFSRSGTGPCHRLTRWPPISLPSPSRTAFPGALLRPLSGRAGCLARPSGTSPSSDFSPNTDRPFTSSAYRPAFAQRSLHAGHPMRSPGVTTCSSAPCRPHTPWFEGWMDSAFFAIVPTRPCPLFGRPVHRRDGSHRFRPEASPQALRIPPRGGHPALLDTPRGQRGVTPAFGYGAPHPSTCGTSTHLSTSLPSAHYEPLRHPLGPGALGVCWSCYQYDHPSGLPVLLVAPCRHAVTHHSGEAGQTCRPLFRPTRTSLPPVQAGSAFASCLSGPSRCSLVLQPANLQTA